MGFYGDKLLPRVVDKACGSDDITMWRRRAVEGLEGIVVEPGFGSGLNLPVLPTEVTKVYAVDPAVLGRELAASRLDESPIDVEFTGLDGQSIPLADSECDAGLLTFTLCTIPDPMAALSELRRIIKPGGALHFLEHGKAPTERLHRWQRRIDPVQRRVAGGCHLSRDHPTLLVEAGFELDWVTAGFARGPKPWTYLYVGRAINP